MARQRFRDAAARLGWHVDACPINRTGPQAEELTIDTAISSREVREGALVISSGLHGVEGFFGSALQLAALATMAGTLASDRVRVVFIHALNPFGFAWLRRVNEDNVDLNRNFLLPGEPYAGAPAQYALLDPILNPKRPPHVWNRYPLAALPVLIKHGIGSLKTAVAGGQYDYPQGLFFGGREASLTQRILAERLPQWIDGCSRVLHLDLHTGLGTWESFRAFADEPVRAAWRARLDDTPLGSTIVEPGSDAVEYETRGSLARWTHVLMRDMEWQSFCVDFGTFHPLRVVAALREENQAHHWGRPDAAGTWIAKRHLKRLFCPHSDTWRERVVAQGLELVTTGIRAVSQP